MEKKSKKVTLIALGAALAVAMRFIFFSDTYFNHSLHYEEGTNFWLVSYTHSFLDSLWIPDANYLPFFLRLLSLILVRIFGVYENYPFLFKLISLACYCLSVTALLSDRFSLLNTRNRVFYILFFLCLPLWELSVAYNTTYGFIFPILVIFNIFCIPSGRVSLWPLLLLPLLLTAKSVFAFLLIPAVIFLLYYRKRAGNSRIAWGFIVLLVLFALTYSLFTSTGEMPTMTARSVFRHLIEYFFISGTTACGFLFILARTIFIKVGLPLQILFFPFILLGNFLTFSSLFFISRGYRQKKPAELLVGSLWGLTVFQYVANIKVYHWLMAEGYSPHEWSPFFFFMNYPSMLISRHTFIPMAIGMLLLIFMVERARNGKLKKIAVPCFFILQFILFIKYPQISHVEPQRNPFINQVFTTIPRQSPERFCFPVIGFPRFNVQHHCNLLSEIPKEISLATKATQIPIEFKKPLVALLVKRASANGPPNFQIKLNAKTLNPIFDRPDSEYLYYWIDKEAGANSLQFSGMEGSVLQMFFYVAQP